MRETGVGDRGPLQVEPLERRERRQVGQPGVRHVRAAELDRHHLSEVAQHRQTLVQTGRLGRGAARGVLRAQSVAVAPQMERDLQPGIALGDLVDATAEGLDLLDQLRIGPGLLRERAGSQEQ